MPELPEVEAARRAIQSTCINKKINRSIIADDTKVIDGVSQSDFQSSLSGKIIVAAHRKGKNLWLELDSPPFPSFQFGMTGAVYIKGIAVTQYKRSAVKEDEEWPSKYSKVFIELDDGLELSFTDKRRFAKVRLLNDPASVPPISELGPDALLEPMKSSEFAEALSKKKTAIKTLLLDQSFISGIGNWVADEVLYQVRIHPMQNASSLSKESCEALHASIKEVIEKAVEAEADCSKYPSNWIFHSREMKPGKAFVDGKKIEFITVGSRTSAFVPELQKLTGGQIEKKARKSKAAKKESEEEENEKPKSKKKASAKKPSKNAEEDKTQKSAKGGAKKKKIEEIEEPLENAEEDKTQKSAKRGAKKKKIEEIEEPSENVEEVKTEKSAKRGAKKKRIEEIEEPSENVEEEKTEKSAKRGAKKKRIEDIKEPPESAEEEMTQKSAKRGAKKKRIEEPSKSAEEEKAQKSAKRGANKKKTEDGNGGSNQKKKAKK